jgi:hypothetical protein
VVELLAGRVPGARPTGAKAATPAQLVHVTILPSAAAVSPSMVSDDATRLLASRCRQRPRSQISMCVAEDLASSSRYKLLVFCEAARFSASQQELPVQRRLRRLARPPLKAG